MAEMAEEKNAVEAPQYMKEALLLATTYTKMLSERDWLKQRIAGSWEYTKNMAIADLDNLTVSYEGERVQSSNISKPTERIALKLTDEYMAKKQAEMNAERDALVRHLDYVNWKIEVVETVWHERMKEMQSAVFTLIFVGHKTYKEAGKIIKKKKKQTVVNRNIAEVKEQIWGLFANELKLRSMNDEELSRLKTLSKEAEEEYGE